MSAAPTPGTPLSVAQLPVCDADPFADDVLAGPWALQETLRDLGPVVRLSQYDAVAMARYDEVRSVLLDWQRFESGSGVGLWNLRDPGAWRTPSLLLESDPPEHDAPRHVLSSILAPRELRKLRDSWSRTAEDLVDSVLEGGTEFDAVPALAQAFPLSVFPDSVGIGSRGRDNLLPWGDLMFNSLGPMNELHRRAAERREELSEWVHGACQRAELQPGGWGSQVYEAADRGELTPEQAVYTVRPMLSAGLDTTVNGISAIIYAFSKNPGSWRRLVDDPRLIRVAFDEAVRWVSPVQIFFRTATHDVEIGGALVPRGQRVMIFLGAANRDPRRWDRPAEFDLDRDPSGHLGFGFGLHQCVGQHVARLEAECLLEALVKRVGDIELTGEPIPHLNNWLRGFDSVPVRVVLR